MYLASVPENGRLKYTIRNSYYDPNQDVYRYRNVFNLGEDPRRYIHRFTDRVMFFDDKLEAAVEQEHGSDPTTQLERLLWDFLPAEERQTINDFSRESRVLLSRLDDREEEEVRRFVHLFDRRRIFYIRYGAVDQSRIYRLNDKLYRPLLFKCRDEKEYYFRRMEMSLPSRELKKYIFVIFNLQRQFEESFSTFMPEALEREKMERFFLEEICRLNEDYGFWQDKRQCSSLRYHLIDYLIRFFDYEFEERSFVDDFIRDFQARYRSFRWPEQEKAVSDDEISELFGRKFVDLKKMNSVELSRLYRAKAKNYHPDSGGEAEKFIQLRHVYEYLKKRI